MYQPIKCDYCDDSYERENGISHLGKCTGLFKEGPCVYKNTGCTFIVSLIFCCYIVCFMCVDREH